MDVWPVTLHTALRKQVTNLGSELIRRREPGTRDRLPSLLGRARRQL